MSVSAAILGSLDRIAKMRELAATAVGAESTTDFYDLVDAAGDEVFEGRVKDQDVSDVDAEVLKGFNADTFRPLLDKFHAYADKDLGLSGANYLQSYLTSIGARCPYEAAEVIAETYGTSRKIAPQLVFPKGTFAASGSLAGLGLHQFGRLTAGVWDATTYDGALDTTKIIGAPIICHTVDATPGHNPVMSCAIQGTGAAKSITVTPDAAANGQVVVGEQAIVSVDGAVFTLEATDQFAVGEWVLLHEGDVCEAAKIKAGGIVGSPTFTLEFESAPVNTFTNAGVVWPMFKNITWTSTAIDTGKKLDFYARPDRIIALESVIPSISNVLYVGPGQKYPTIAAALTAAAAGGATLGTAAVVGAKAYSVIDFSSGWFSEGDTVTLTVDGVDTVYDPQSWGLADDIAAAINANIGNGAEATGQVLAEVVGETCVVTCVTADTITSAVVSENAMDSVDHEAVEDTAEVPPQSAVILYAPGVTPPTAAQLIDAAEYNISIAGIEELTKNANVRADGQIIEITERHQGCAVSLVNGTAQAPDFEGRVTAHRYDVKHATSDLIIEFSSPYAATASTVTIEKAAAHIRRRESTTWTIYPLTFGGERDVTFATGAVQLADPLFIAMHPGDEIWVATAGTCPAGKVLPAVLTVPGDSIRLKDWTPASVDLAITVTPWTDDIEVYPDNFTADIGPTAIYGHAANKREPYVVFIGNSILDRTSGYEKWPTKFLADRDIPYTVCSRPGEATTTIALNQPRLEMVLPHADIIINCLVTNDMGDGTYETVKGKLDTWWAHLATFGVPVYQSTVPPYTNAGNSADGGSVSLAEAAAVNAYIRSDPSPLSGHIDFSDFTSSARDSNRWKTGFTTDGLHPLAAALPAIWLQVEADARFRAIFGEAPLSVAKVYDGTMSVLVAANDTYVAGFAELPIPGPGLLRGFIVKGAAPGGTATGTLTVNVGIGTVAANVDADLVDSGEVDVMVATGDQTAAFVHGDTAGDNVAAYFDLLGGAKYFATAGEHLHLNFLGKAGTAGDGTKTVTCKMEVYALVDPLP